LLTGSHRRRVTRRRRAHVVEKRGEGSSLVDEPLQLARRQHLLVIASRRSIERDDHRLIGSQALRAPHST